MMPKYNGHKNWNFWNVSLWLNNDEPMYAMCKDAIQTADNREDAARMILNTLKVEQGDEPRTPDGAPYTISSIRAALVGM